MRISDWSSDVCSSDLSKRIGGVERDASRRLLNIFQYRYRLGNTAVRCNQIRDFTHRTMCQKGIVLSRASRYDLDVRPLFDQRGAGSVEILADGRAMEAPGHCSDTHISSPFTTTLRSGQNRAGS